ncbi:MAG TPA: MBL fold metallo-hydrolase, partial [Thermodesulfobacteriota bacterium]
MAIGGIKDLMLEEYVNQQKIHVYDKPKEVKKRHIRELLFGEAIKVIKETDDRDEYLVEINIEGNSEKAYLSKKDRKNLKTGKLLELYFIDVGQGDAMLIQTPSNKRILIDGGPDESVNEFLNKLYNLKKRKEEPLDLHYVVMTHTDKDHAEGLIKIFKNPNVTIHSIYHSGIGKYKSKRNRTARHYPAKNWLTEAELFDDINIFDSLESTRPKPAKQFSRLISAINVAIKRTKERTKGGTLIVKRVDNLTPDLVDLESQDLTIKFLGPINEGPSPPKLRRYTTDAQTINGNSVCLQIKYKKCKIMLCGDMNAKSEEVFLKHYTEKIKEDFPMKDSLATNKVDLTAHIFKANHHGSEDFSKDFLDTIRPSIGVVSSGIQPDYAHPRAVLLGCMGKYTNEKTERPILFSTKISVGYKKFNLKEWMTLNSEKARDKLDSTVIDK